MSELADALVSLNEGEVAKLVQRELDASVDAISILNELREGMDIVGERFKSGEYFLSELIVSSEIFKETMKVVEPHLQPSREGDKLAKMVLGTAKGDIHNIGKDIVATLLRIAGFEVYDLGIDVAPSVFVNILKETGAPILGMSCLLTPYFESMKETVKAVEAAGLRDNVKIIVGGGIIDERVRKHCGADAWTDDALEGVEICKKFAQEVR